MNVKNILICVALSFGLIVYAGGSNNVVDGSAVTEYMGTMLPQKKHVVAKGETVYSIASAYKVSVADIYKLNPEAAEGIGIDDVLVIPAPKATVVRYTDHVIGMQETLYGVSRKYSITVDDLKAANGGLDGSTFKAGATIRIPEYEQGAAREIAADTRKKHTVGTKETLYSLSKAWDVSIAEIEESNPIVKIDGLKEGMVLYIPRVGNAYGETVRRSVYPVNNKIKIGILLPFLKDNDTVEKAKIVEYYEGFLIALQELKAKGLNADVFTFDIGSTTSTLRLEGILETTEAQELTLIIGGISENQIDMISRFAKDKQIKFIVPFGSASAQLKTNTYIYQAINSHTNLYDDIADTFIKRFPKEEYNILFLNESVANNNKKDFIAALRKRLTKAQLPFRDVSLSSQLKLEKHVSLEKKNVIIPISSSELTVRKIMPLLDAVDNANITLFGYPEWQVYTSFAPSFHKYDTYLYSIFYFNETQEEVKNFEGIYKKWFGKELVNSFPKYAHMGYDTGLYFLSALHRYGPDFESHLDSVNVATLQSSIHFSQVGNGGRINKGLYFIHYKTDKSIEKLDHNKK